MNIILFSSDTARARHFALSVPMLLCTALLFVALSSAGISYIFSDPSATAQSLAEVEQLRQELGEQQDLLAEMKLESQDQLDALAMRMGELNAKAIRLDALGRRLTGMADLDKGEFDFDTQPGLGGPETPLLMPAAGQIPDLFADLVSMKRTMADQEHQLTVVEGLLLNRKLRDRVYPRGRPVRSGYISSYFGRRTDPFNGKSAWHRGVDFAGTAGSEVIAVGGGVVTFSGPRYGFGNMVEINHGNGYVTRYAHNERNLVASGDQVQPGQTIALMGSTGRATGPNLHFEVLHRGKHTDPVKHVLETT